MKSGWITLSIGTCVGIVGGILYSVGQYQPTQTLPPGIIINPLPQPSTRTQILTAGVVLLGCGSTIIGVSIPLLCFGDNTKREANTLFKTYNILK